MKRIFLLAAITIAMFTVSAQKVVRTVIGSESGYFVEPVECYRYDSTEVDIYVWNFQKKLDEAWERTVNKQIFDFDFNYSMSEVKGKAQQKSATFNFYFYIREWELYQGLSEEIRGPYKVKE